MDEKEKEVLSKVVDALTEKPLIIEVEVKAKSFLQKLLLRFNILPKVHRFELKPIVVGNMFRISSKVILIPDDLFQKGVTEGLINGCFDHMDNLIYIVATGLQNDHKEPSKHLLRLIRNEFTQKDIFNVFDAIMAQINVSDFMKSIILIKGVNVLNAPVKDAKSAIIPE